MPITEEYLAVDIEVRGTIKDEEGNPLVGASVRIKGTDKGTVTDATGNFLLLMPEKGGSLIVSYINYEAQEIKVTKAGDINVVLKLALKPTEEVVVVGYGTQRKKEVTTSVAQISGKELRESQSVTVSNALSGKVPGLFVSQRSSRPGADGASFSVRGISTYRDNSALIVVDGVANRDGLDRIDPNDIESITVLKDASAAIYLSLIHISEPTRPY